MRIAVLIFAAWLPAASLWGQTLFEELRQVESAIASLRKLEGADAIETELDDLATAATRAAQAAAPGDELDIVAIVRPDAMVLGSGETVPLPPSTAASRADGSFHEDAVIDGGLADGGVVRIRHRVTFSTDDARRYEAIIVESGGRLEVSTGAALRVRTLIGLPRSQIVIQGERIRVLFLDQPLPALDRDEMSGGLVTVGDLIIRGIDVEPWVRCRRAGAQGDRIGDLIEMPASWSPLDPLIVSSTRQPFYNRRGRIQNAPVNERGTIADRLMFDHPAAGDRLPVVANLRRSIVFSGENGASQTTRPHFLVAGRAHADVSNCMFAHGGRTLIRPSILDRDDTGKLINRPGRYGGLHFHHAIGRRAPPGEWQHRAVGNLVLDPTRWGITVHSTSFADVSRNVVVGAQGSGINTESGNEYGCRFDGNLVLATTQAIDRRRGGVINASAGVDTGGDGGGIWLRSPVHIVTNNVVHGCAGSAFMVNGYYPKPLPGWPRFHGDRNTGPVVAGGPIKWAGNEAVGCLTGLWLTWSQRIATPKIDRWPAATYADQRIANCHIGVEAWHETALVLDGFHVTADPTVVVRNDGERYSHHEPRRTSAGLWFNARNYENGGHRVRNLTIDGPTIGVLVPVNPTGSDATGDRFLFSIDGGRVSAFAPLFIPPRSDRTVRVNATLVARPDLAAESMRWTSADGRVIARAVHLAGDADSEFGEIEVPDAIQ